MQRMSGQVLPDFSVEGRPSLHLLTKRPRRNACTRLKTAGVRALA